MLAGWERGEVTGWVLAVVKPLIVRLDELMEVVGCFLV